MFQHLIRYKAKHGDFSLSKHRGGPNKALARLAAWLGNQRQASAAGKLRPERKEQMEAAGYVFGPLRRASPRFSNSCAPRVRKPTEGWMTMYRALCGYASVYGTPNIPVHCPEFPKLAAWATRQRNLYNNGALARESVELLFGIGFAWNLADAAWTEKYQELCAFIHRNGHCRLDPLNKDGTTNALSHWAVNQRYQRKLGALDHHREALLDSVNFDWDPTREPDSDWYDGFYVLDDFRTKYGHFDVPAVIRGIRLRTWIERQRAAWREGSLSVERIAKLNSINFPWKERQAAAATARQAR